MSVVSPTTITCTTGAHTPGTVLVVVTNADSQSARLENGFSYSNFSSNASTQPAFAITSFGGIMTNTDAQMHTSGGELTSGAIQTSAQDQSRTGVQNIIHAP